MLWFVFVLWLLASLPLLLHLVLNIASKAVKKVTRAVGLYVWAQMVSGPKSPVDASLRQYDAENLVVKDAYAGKQEPSLGRSMPNLFLSLLFTTIYLCLKVNPRRLSCLRFLNCRRICFKITKAAIRHMKAGVGIPKRHAIASSPS